MVDVMERSLDHPAPLISPVMKYNSILFKPGDRADEDDPESHIYPPLPDERREGGIITPPASLKTFRKASRGKNNIMTLVCGLGWISQTVAQWRLWTSTPISA